MLHIRKTLNDIIQIYHDILRNNTVQEEEQLSSSINNTYKSYMRFYILIAIHIILVQQIIQFKIYSLS